MRTYVRAISLETRGSEYDHTNLSVPMLLRSSRRNGCTTLDAIPRYVRSMKRNPNCLSISKSTARCVKMSPHVYDDQGINTDRKRGRDKVVNRRDEMNE